MLLMRQTKTHLWTNSARKTTALKSEPLGWVTRKRLGAESPRLSVEWKITIPSKSIIIRVRTSAHHEFALLGVSSAHHRPAAFAHFRANQDSGAQHHHQEQEDEEWGTRHQRRINARQCEMGGGGVVACVLHSLDCIRLSAFVCWLRPPFLDTAPFLPL